MGVSSAIVSHFLDPSDSVWGFFPRWRGVFSALLERAGTWPSRAGYPCGFVPTPLERQGTLACPAGAPFLGKKWGKEPPGEEVPPGTPWCGVVWEAVPLTGYLACGPHSEARNGPPTGWAGWERGQVPFGKRRRKPFRFPLFPPVNEPPLPPARAGGRAMRRWSLRPQARPLPDQSPSPVPPTREWGSKGKEPPSPWCSFPYFFKEIGPRPGGLRSRPFQRRGETLPHPSTTSPNRAQVEASVIRAFCQVPIHPGSPARWTSRPPSVRAVRRPSVPWPSTRQR